MRIHHLAIWTKNLEKLKDFYVSYFNCKESHKYRNDAKDFESYFLSFGEGPKIELMQMPGIPDNLNNASKQYLGLIHFAISIGDKQQVVTLTNQLRTDGFTVESEPRQTGDGYFESVVLDPDGNRIELIV
jgi:lactoylglutathione lyase